MSFILEALKKSERERRAGKVPDLSVVVHEPGHRHGSWLLPTVLALILINLAAVGYWFYRDHQVIQTPSDEPLSRATPSPAAQPPLPLPEAEGYPQSGASRGSASDAPSGIRGPLPMVQGPERLDAGHASETFPQRLMPPASPSRYPEMEDERLDAELEAEGTEDPGLSAALPRPSRSLALPLVGELPVEIRQKIPIFRITMFAYDENPRERFVIVNMQKLRVGDVLPGGILLIDIRSEDLVAEVDGHKFRIPRY